MYKKINNSQGLILPLAILVMLIASGIIISMGHIILDNISVDNDSELHSIAKREAENALVYGIWGTNTSQLSGGHKKICNSTGWDYSTTKTEITNEDKGLTETNSGYKIKRFINYQQPGYVSISDKQSTLVGIAEIYDTNGTVKVAEAAVAMDMNIGYDGGNGTTACNSSTVQMHKETWRTVK